MDCERDETQAKSFRNCRSIRELAEVESRSFRLCVATDELEDLKDRTDFKEFSLHEVRAATKGFSEKEKLGEGTFGVVYRGTLLDGQSFAFKRIRPRRGKKYTMRDFEKEVRTMSTIRHRNVIQLHGYCHTKSEHILVYELADGGTLERLELHCKAEELDGAVSTTTRRKPICLKQRIQLALEVAGALSHLHSQGIIHRDIKPANILLTRDLVPKVADFGLLKLLGPNRDHTYTKVAGTVGYMDPVTFRSGKTNFASDVYSFGIVLLGMLTARGPGVTARADLAAANQVGEASWREDGSPVVPLRRWVEALLSAGEFRTVVDPYLAPIFSLEDGSGFGSPKGMPEGLEARVLLDALRLGVRCTDFDTKNRPTMAEVTDLLQGLLCGEALPPGPQHHTFSVPDIVGMTQNVSALSQRGEGRWESRLSSLFLGELPWDGETCLIQRICGHTDGDISSWLLALQGLSHHRLLPLKGSCLINHCKAFLVYRFHNCRLLEDVLLAPRRKDVPTLQTSGEDASRASNFSAATSTGFGVSETAVGGSLGAAPSKKRPLTTLRLLTQCITPAQFGAGHYDSSVRSAHQIHRFPTDGVVCGGGGGGRGSHKFGTACLPSRVWSSPATSFAPSSEGLSFPVCMGIALSVCEALCFLHRREIAHGAVCPAAVVLDEQHTALLLLPSMPPAPIADRRNRTRSALERRAAMDTDIYGLGLLLLELMAGRATSLEEPLGSTPLGWSPSEINPTEELGSRSSSFSFALTPPNSTPTRSCTRTSTPVRERHSRDTSSSSSGTMSMDSGRLPELLEAGGSRLGTPTLSASPKPPIPGEPKVRGKLSEVQVFGPFVGLALECIREEAESRPEIQEVINRLRAIQDELCCLMPVKPRGSLAPEIER